MRLVLGGVLLALVGTALSALVSFHSLHVEPFIMHPTSDPEYDLTERQHLASWQHGFGTHLSSIGLSLVGPIGRSKNDRRAWGRLAKYFKTFAARGHEKTVVQHEEVKPFIMQHGDALVGTLHFQDSEPIGRAVF
jgi:hypothetical protein